MLLGSVIASVRRSLMKATGTHLCAQELDAGAGVLVADGDQTADDQECGVARSALTHDRLLRRESRRRIRDSMSWHSCVDNPAKSALIADQRHRAHPQSICAPTDLIARSRAC
jgi:hypothetical protein